MKTFFFSLKCFQSQFRNRIRLEWKIPDPAIIRIINTDAYCTSKIPVDKVLNSSFTGIYIIHRYTCTLSSLYNAQCSNFSLKITPNVSSQKRTGTYSMHTITPIPSAASGHCFIFCTQYRLCTMTLHSLRYHTICTLYPCQTVLSARCNSANCPLYNKQFRCIRL